MQTNSFDNTQIFRTMSPSVTETTVTPRTVSFTRNQLAQIQNHAEQAVQTSPKLDEFTPISEKGVQAANEFMDA